MEQLLSNLNSSITAMERGISPEEAQANHSSPPQSSIPESGPMLVRDLAAFVARLADGIERFPVSYFFKFEFEKPFFETILHYSIQLEYN